MIESPESSAARRPSVAPRLLVVSELFGAPLDHGEKVLACELTSRLLARPGVAALWVQRPGARDETGALPGLESVWANRLFASPSMARRVQAARPARILYIAFGAGTVATFVRARSLSRMMPGVPVTLLAVQRTPMLGSPVEQLRRRLSPDAVLVLSRAHASAAKARIDSRVGVVYPGVDGARFVAAPPDIRSRQRRKWGLPEDRPIVLHVGHLEAGRNLAWLERVASEIDCTVVALCSPDGPDEEAVRRALQDAGVHVVKRLMPDVATAYQMADCYLFPVQGDRNAIETPLSVLEALACGIPVVSTPLGGLPEILGDHPSVVWASTVEEAVAGVSRALAAAADPSACRAAVAGLTWEGAADRVLAFVEAGPDGG